MVEKLVPCEVRLLADHVFLVGLESDACHLGDGAADGKAKAADGQILTLEDIF